MNELYLVGVCGILVIFFSGMAIGGSIAEKQYKKEQKNRKSEKPVVIEVVQFTDWHEARDFLGAADKECPNGFLIYMLKGDMLASLNDFIIKNVNGEFYLCKPDIFVKT